MIDVCNIHIMKPLLESHGFHFSKAKGQNFLIAGWVPERIAEESGVDSTVGVLEIGPGIGPLTQQLALRAKKVCAVELDERLEPILEKTVGEFDNLEIIWNDILKLDVPALVAGEFPGLRPMACANLPYYITSPVITMLLESRLPIKAVTVMIQKEAADRLCTPVGSRDSGAITVCTNYYAEVKQLFNVSRGSFMPAPNVDSTVIRLDIREYPAVEVSDEKKFFKMVKAAFAQRRKTALNSISSGMGLSNTQVADALRASGLEENVRAEKLTMDELATLCENL